MTKDELRTHLHNAPLLQAIAIKGTFDATLKALRDALVTLRAVGVSDKVLTEVQGKIDGYSRISGNYGNMIETTWGVTWQAETIIRKYVSCPAADIDLLPNTIPVP